MGWKYTILASEIWILFRNCSVEDKFKTLKVDLEIETKKE